MSRSRMPAVLVLVGSIFAFTACSSSSDDGGEASATSDPDTSSDGQPNDGAESDDPSTDDDGAESETGTATDDPVGDTELSTEPIDAVALGAGPEVPCTVFWSDAAIATLFAAEEAVHEPGVFGTLCVWTAGPPSVSLSLGFDGESGVTSLIEDYGATALDLGDNAALLIEDDAGQTHTTVALNVGDTAVSIVVTSADHVDNAEILAENLAGRLS